MDNLHEFVVVQPTLLQITDKAEKDLKLAISQGVKQAIQEIIHPVVDRSVTIALITTRELVLKDFALDPDHEKIKKAAHLTSKNLAGSLALVTCREPLRMSLINNLNIALRNELYKSDEHGGVSQHISDETIKEHAQQA